MGGWEGAHGDIGDNALSCLVVILVMLLFNPQFIFMS
jgi:hypothetical protein